ncbi:MAG TPA: hypothetical protein VFE24_08195 [Pirellulales bacterium]|jgi:hypothetical protein|nr:hypothetical protein [Pirellulales bacterium]
MSTLGISSNALSYSAFQAITGTTPNSSSPAGSADPLLATGATGASTPASPADALLAATGGSSPQAAARPHHHGHGGFKKIQDAVTSALDAAQNDPSADPNSIIEQAIAGVFSGSSDPSQASASGAAGSATGGAASGSNVASVAAPGASSGDSSDPFAQLLQSLGVSPQQFHTDFLNAIQDAQSGQVNASTALQSIPSGSVIDALA